MKFEFDGEKYKKASTHQEEWGNKIIAELRLHGDESILDLGCGDGRLTAKLATQVPQGMVVGLDASQGMIEAAKKHETQNLKFELQDVNSFRLDRSFDLIFSNAALHWIKDHRALLSRVLKSLKQHGQIRWNFAAAGNCSNFFKVIHEVMCMGEFSAYFESFLWPWYMPPLEEYQKLLQEFSFQEADVWGENADRFFPDSETMIKWVDQPSLVPFLACVDDSDKAVFRDAVVERMLEETLQDDGRCFETFRRINVRAKR
jgi:trans-aconitate methyltransferase